MRFDLTDLRLFCEVVDAGSITAGAERSALALAAASTRIRNMEAVLGAPLIFLSFQLMIGRRPWLPRVITDRSLSRVDFEKVVDLAAPWLAKAERLMRPRLQFLARPPAEYLVGLVCLLLSLILFLPIPLGNMLPAFTICILALGVLERDGVWIGIGLACAILAVVIVWGVMLALLWSALFVLGNLFGITLPFG